MRNMRSVLAAFALVSCRGLVSWAAADEPLLVRHVKHAHTCHSVRCGPYAVCGAHCRVGCPDRYSCGPLFGAYGPYSGPGYWSKYTF